MLINEVESIVGMTKKSIRYYEDSGLLTPSRNSENDYRIYNKEDIEKLKVIKFLRELGVPIKDLQSLNENKLSLSECLQDRIHKIDDEQDNYIKIKSMCEEIIRSNDEFNNIDITKYFQEVNILNKEGFTMRDVKTSKSKKIIGAIISSVIFGAFFIAMVSGITYFQLTEEDRMPWIVYGIVMCLFGFPIIGIVYNLVIRIKEILGGEEDEASKY